MTNARLLLLVALGGCTKWAYYPVYDAMSAQESGITVDIEVTEGVTGQLGQLTITNGSERSAQLVWDGVSVITPDGVQEKVYKGDVRVLDKQRAVPNQPIEAGAKIKETVVMEVSDTVVLPRPATTVDWALGWVYGLGILIGNAWRPDEEAKQEAIPNWEERVYTLVVPVELDGEDVRVRVELKPSGVGASKYIPVDN